MMTLKTQSNWKLQTYILGDDIEMRIFYVCVLGFVGERMESILEDIANCDCRRIEIKKQKKERWKKDKLINVRMTQLNERAQTQHGFWLILSL